MEFIVVGKRDNDRYEVYDVQNKGIACASRYTMEQLISQGHQIYGVNASEHIRPQDIEICGFSKNPSKDQSTRTRFSYIEDTKRSATTFIAGIKPTRAMKEALKQRRLQTATPKAGDVVWFSTEDGGIRYGALLSNKNLAIANGHQLRLGANTKIHPITEKNSISKDEIETFKALAKNQEDILDIDNEIARLQNKRKELCDNIGQLAKDMTGYCTARKNKQQEAEQRKVLGVLEKNAGITYEEAKDKLIDAIIVGAQRFTIRHSEIAPYTTGYAVSFSVPTEDRFKFKRMDIATNSGKINGYVDLFDKMSESTFYNLLKKGWTKTEFTRLFKDSEQAWKMLPDRYSGNKYPVESGYYSRALHVADGYEVDGFYDIVSGKCHGTYSTWTTTSQNNLSEVLIMLKGYCPDTYFSRHGREPYAEECLSFAQKVYSRHGIDSDLSNLSEWAKRNPSRCGVDSPYYQENIEAEEDMER